MDIGVDASRYAHAEATGVEWYSYHIINNLIPKILRSKNNKIIFYSKNFLKFEDEVKITIKKFESRIQKKYLHSRRLWTLFALSREMWKKPPDILFVPSHVLPLAQPKKSVITIHDTAFKYLKNSYSRFQYLYLDWSTKYAVNHATKIIVPSDATKDDLIHFFKCPKNKISVIPHGFNPPTINQSQIDKVFKNSEIFKYFKITKDLNYLLFVGRLETKKNLKRLVQAFKNFSDVHDNFKLILAGKRGVGFDQILNQVNELKIIDKVIMPGYITEEEKAALYKYSKAFVFPSLYEGFGLPLLEAFHYGKPVLTSHVSCLPEVAGDAAYYVDPYDPESIEAGLDKIVNDKNYIQKLVTLGKERLKLFSWSECARKTFKVLTK